VISHMVSRPWSVCRPAGQPSHGSVPAAQYLTTIMNKEYGAGAVPDFSELEFQ